jgi:hypothetical protein
MDDDTLSRNLDEKFFTNGLPDENKIINELSNLNKTVHDLKERLAKTYEGLNSAQKMLVVALSGARNSGYTESIDKILSDIMRSKTDLEEISKNKIYPLVYYSRKLDHLKILKDEINKDEYLQEQWNKLLFYMRMKNK